jgi:hypothetical protein
MRCVPGDPVALISSSLQAAAGPSGRFTLLLELELLSFVQITSASSFGRLCVRVRGFPRVLSRKIVRETRKGEDRDDRRELVLQAECAVLVRRAGFFFGA